VNINNKKALKQKMLQGFTSYCPGAGFEPAIPCSQNIGFLVIF